MSNSQSDQPESNAAESPPRDSTRDIGRLVAHIPARGGSKRCPAKNLRMLHGKPMLAYAIECAKACEQFDAIYVNTDSPEIASLAKTWGVEVYLRKEELANDQATGDDFTADFMENVPCDAVIMINPVCPLVMPEDVRAAIELYQSSDVDTLITCSQTQMQGFVEGEPINVDPALPLPPSQFNQHIQILNWAVTIWDCQTFLASYDKNRSGYLGTKRALLPIDPLRAVKVSHEQDFRLAERLLAARNLPTTDATFWSAT